MGLSVNMWGEDEVYKTSKFGSAADEGTSSGYSGEFTTTTDGFSVVVKNGNTNGTNWALVKFGTKGKESIGFITTKNAIDKAITKVTINISAITANNITSITLYSGNSATTCTTNLGTFTKSTGKQSVTIKSPEANKFYMIEFVCKSASSNGPISVSQVDFYKGENATPVTSLDLYIAGDRTDDKTGHNVGDTYTLPDEDYVTAECGGKTFVGWSTSEISVPITKPKPSFYAPGDEVTLAADNTFYAVFADEGESGGATTETLTVGTNGETTWSNAVVTESAIVGNVLFTALHTNANSGKYYSNDKSWRFYDDKDGLTISTKDGSNITQVVITWKTGAPGTPTNWSKSGSTSPYTYTTSTNTNSVTFLRNGTNVLFQVIAVTYVGTTYSNYTTSCAATGKTLISYNKNTEDEVTGDIPESVEQENGVAYTVSTATLTRSGYIFKGWNTNKDATEGISTIPAASITGTPITLYAIWQAKTVQSVVVSGTPATFWKGDAFNHDGITVTANYDDATSEDVTAKATFSTPDMTSAGEKTITVTYNGKTDTYTINVQTIANTQATAYTVAQAKAIVDAGKDLATEVYVKGIVSSIPTPWSSQYKNITYNISDNGETTGQQFQLYRCATNGAEVGDKVIAKGKMKKFNSTYEFDAGNTIVSIRKVAKLEWSAGAYTAELGLGEYDYPTLTKTPTTLTGVTYSSSNTDVATINSTTGEIALVAEGETTITASFAGDATYDAAEDATYILTVAAEVQRFTITYNSNGGSVIAPVENQTNLPNEFPTPTKDWKVFGGWYLDNETFENPAVANAPLTDNTTLFAKWNDPLSVAEMIALIPNANDNKSDIYGYGFIKKVDNVNSGAATYWITDGTNDFEVYKGKNINNADFTYASELPVGNKVMIFGNIKNFNGTPEFDANNYLLQNEAVTTPVTGVSLDKTAATVYVGQTTTLVANILPTYATNKNVTWSSNKESVATVADGVVTGVAKGSATITVTTEDGNFTATCAVTVEELPIWATTYTSNVTVGTDKVKLAEAYQPADYPEDGYEAKKTGSSSSAGSIEIKVPVGTCELHYHAAAWSSNSETLTIKNGNSPVAEHSILADAGLKNNTPFTLKNNPVDEYYMIKFEPALTEETTLTFSASSNRFILFGVNAIQPAAITIDPALKDFGEVKQGFDAEQVFTLTPNAFATGTITAEIDGEGFSASAVTDNKVTVTFAPTEITDYNATLVIKHDGTQMCTATLSGKGITATTPEIVVPDEPVDFGKVKQDATIADKTVTVTLNYLDAATASISENDAFTISPTSLVQGENTITISATAATSGTKNATITITGTGATTKTIAVKMDVTSKWAGEYTSNVEVGNDKVIIAEEEYEAIKTGSGSSQGSTTITIPEGAYALHFHAAGWNSEDVTLAVKNGDAELGSFSLYKDAGVKGSGPSYTLQGENYDTDQYFHVEFDALEEETTFTFAATSGNRFVLYGVNQEGAAVEVLQSIEIQGTATALNYEIDQTFVPTGLKVVGTFQKGEEEPTTRDLSSSEFDWSFNPATFTSTEQTSVVVTATAKENTEITASKTIENIVVTAPVVEISTTSTKVDFGTVLKDATVDNKLVYVTFKNCTEASVALSGDDAAKFTIDAEKVEEGDFNWVTVGVADGTTATTGEYAATLTIHAEGAIADIVLPVTLFVEAPDVCDGSDDFETVEAVTSYGQRTTTAGWTATNSRVDVVDDYTYFTINGKTSASGVITSPVLEGGIASLKLRYGHLVANETNGVSFRVDIKQDEEVVKTYTITKPNDQVVRDEVYTEMISDVNVAGTFQIVITNLCPSQSTSNKDRVAIGRLCWTKYGDFVLPNKASGALATICLPKKIASVENATLFSISHGNTSMIEFAEVTDLDNTVAGMPYLVEVTEAGSVKFFTEGDAVLEPVPAADAYGFVGSLIDTDQPVPSDGSAILISGGKLHTAGAECYLTKNHAYITTEYLPATPPAVSAPGRRLVLTNDEAQVVTGLNAIQVSGKTRKMMINNQMVIIREGKMYNAQGTLMK